MIDSKPLSIQYINDVLSRQPLEPLEYCQRWVEIPPEERGYRKACIATLAEATALSPRTINDWGANFDRRPDHVWLICIVIKMNWQRHRENTKKR